MTMGELGELEVDGAMKLDDDTFELIEGAELVELLGKRTLELV